MSRYINNETLRVFVPIEYTALAVAQIIRPYRSGVIYSE
jgi:hypothetical protein